MTKFFGGRVEPSQVVAAGVAAYHAGRFEEAEAASEELIRTWPNRADGYELKGILCFQAKRLDEAVQYFRRTLSFNGRNANVWNNLGVALMTLERWNEADVAFLNTLRLLPDHLAAARGRGLLLEKQERPAEAANHYLALIKRLGPRDDVLEDYIRAMVAHGSQDAILGSLPAGFHPAAVALLTARFLLDQEQWAGAEKFCLDSLSLAKAGWSNPDQQLEYFRSVFYVLDVLRQNGHGGELEARFRHAYFTGLRDAFRASGARLPLPRLTPEKRMAVLIPGFISEHFGPTVLMLGLLIRFMKDLGWEAVLVNCNHSLYNPRLAGIHGIVALPAGSSRYSFAGREISVFTPEATNFRDRFEEIGAFLTQFEPAVIFTAGTELNPYSDLLAAAWPTQVVPMNWQPPFCYGHLYHVPSEDPAVVEHFRQALSPQAELLPYGRLFPFVLPQPTIVRTRAEFGLNDGDFVYLIAGLVMEAAFTPEYQRILAEILEQNERARLLVIGTTEVEFPWREPRLERLRGTRLFFTAYQPHLRSVLRLADAFLHPPAPRNGGTVRQCLAEGLPVVVARQSGLKLVVPEEDMLDGLDAYRETAVRLALDPVFLDRAIARSRELDARFEAEAAEYMGTLEDAAKRTMKIFQLTRNAHFLYSDQAMPHGG